MAPNRQLCLVTVEWIHLFIHLLIPLNTHQGSHKCNTDILSRDITDNSKIRNPYLTTHIQMGGYAKKKFRQNRWQVNVENLYGMMSIMHGDRETQEVKKIPQCYRTLFQRNIDSPLIKCFQVCKLVYTITPVLDWLKLKRMLLSVPLKIIMELEQPYTAHGNTKHFDHFLKH